ncbi:DUF3667 domain-containing protein [Rhodanobacter umsongensis]|uniref:DUF3667 domain-containing protein n=1 Tax=Rhodanobacter umsongensis TaxID=633153 RepID=A0ABW0JK93_9GAMM
MKPLTSYDGLHCTNCGALMQGEFCHHCGQSIHSVLQPMHHMLEETVETVLHIDGRIVHTLPPLLLKPGFLTMEYFGGRRVRYIAPFRLMFVLCLLSFFLIHLAVDQIATRASKHSHPLVPVTSGMIEHAATPAEVRKALQEELSGLQSARDTGLLARSALDQADVAGELRQKANQRLIALGAAPMPATSLAAPAAAATVNVAGDAKPGDALHKAAEGESKPVQIGWLPDVVNARLTALGRQMQRNWRAVKHGDPAASAEAKQRMINGVFGVLPPIMFVMIPLFAVLLKLFYIFRRRLYMEHLIVALHSHAFLFLWLLLCTLLAAFAHWLEPHALWTTSPLNWLERILVLWAPIYLLLMQKRVYRQGWPMTLLKFWLVGWCYFWLLAIALMVAAALGMAN